MNKETLCALLAVILAGAGGVSAAQSSFETLLTVSDVQKVTGLKGIRLLPRDTSKGRHWDLNFHQQDGAMVVAVGITQGERAPAVWKGKLEELAIIKNQGGKVIKVAGVGDEAFEAELAGRSFHFRKGKSAVTVESGEKGNFSGVPLLSSEQIRGLAKIIASRL